MRPHKCIIDHRADLGVREQGQRVELVRGAETVKEVQEGHAGLERRRLGDQGRIMRLLDRARSEEGESRRAHRHHVGVVAEDGERLGRDGARGNMKDGGSQLARDLEHIGDHQHQALGGREGRRQGPRLERAVDRAGRAPFALHFLHDGDVPPNVRDPHGGPLVRQLRHGRGRGDRKNRAGLVDAVRDMGDGRIAVHRRDLVHAFSHFPLAPESSRWRGRGTARSRRRNPCIWRNRTGSAGRARA